MLSFVLSLMFSMPLAIVGFQNCRTAIRCKLPPMFASDDQMPEYFRRFLESDAASKRKADAKMTLLTQKVEASGTPSGYGVFF